MFTSKKVDLVLVAAKVTQAPSVGPNHRRIQSSPTHWLLKRSSIPEPQTNRLKKIEDEDEDEKKQQLVIRPRTSQPTALFSCMRRAAEPLQPGKPPASSGREPRASTPDGNYTDSLAQDRPPTYGVHGGHHLLHVVAAKGRRYDSSRTAPVLSLFEEHSGEEPGHPGNAAELSLHEGTIDGRIEGRETKA